MSGTTNSIGLTINTATPLNTLNGGSGRSVTPTSGSVLFYDSTGIQQNNSNLNWDNTNLILNSKNVTIGLSNAGGGGVRLNENNIYFRTGADINHGLGYYGNAVSKSWNTLTNIDGPVLFGFSGGVLGTSSGTKSVLHWTTNQINFFDSGASALAVNYAVGFGGSTLGAGNYFNIGTGGRNIGVVQGGSHFISYNLDYNATGSYYLYNTTGNFGTTVELSSSGFAIKTSSAAGTTALIASLNTNFIISNNGSMGLRTGSNGCRGSVTLSGSSTTVNTTAAVTGCYIGISNTGPAGSAPASSYTFSINNGVSFTINNSILDASPIQWFIMS